MLEIAIGAIAALASLFITKFDHEERLDSTENINQKSSRFHERLISKHAHILDDTELRFPRFTCDDIDLENDRYLWYLPYEGYTNQYYSLVRGLYLAKSLNRTLLIPPITASKHNKGSSQFLDWRLIVNFTSFDQNEMIRCQYKFIDENIASKMRNYMGTQGTECFTYGRWKHFWVLGKPASTFSTAFGLIDHIKLDWHDLPKIEDRKASYLIDVFRRKDDLALLCAANLQHLTFGNQMDDYWRNISPSDNILKAAWSYLNFVGVKNGRFGAVHWRRGDFEQACKNKLIEHCWPSEKELVERILSVYEKHGIDVFLVGTNDVGFKLDLSERGIDVFRMEMGEEDDEAWNELAGVAMDTWLFAMSDYFIGNRYSSISFSTIIRRKGLGLGNMTETF